MAYISLYSYFSSRDRFGVVANNSRHVKDLYLIPLSATDPIPSKLLPFEGRGSQAPRRAVCGTRGSLRTMHGGGSAPSCCAFTHRVAFEEGSGPRPGFGTDEVTAHQGVSLKPREG